MASVWQNNKLLRKWEKKHFMENANGDFNYNLAHPLEDPLVMAISKYLKVNKEYIYVGAGISQFINAIVGMPQWEKVYLSEIEFALYKRTALINKKEVIFLKNNTIKELINDLKAKKSNINDLLCISSPRWFDGGMLTKEEIKLLLKYFKGTIVIDEAYVDYSYCEDGILDLVLENSRLMLFRSFSKKFLAPGYRTGYMITINKIDGLRNTIIPPHSVTSYSENFFKALLLNKKILNAFKDTRQYIMKNRDYLYNSLKEQKNMNIIKSYANFITIVFDDIETLNNIYDKLNDLAGIQKFEEGKPFLKIWVNNELFSEEIVKRLNGDSQ